MLTPVQICGSCGFHGTWRVRGRRSRPTDARQPSEIRALGAEAPADYLAAGELAAGELAGEGRGLLRQIRRKNEIARTDGILGLCDKPPRRVELQAGV